MNKNLITKSLSNITAITLIAFGGFCVSASTATFAADVSPAKVTKADTGNKDSKPHATKEEAIVLVKKAVAYIKANGREKAFAEINNKKGQFIDGDLYAWVTRTDGVVLAHGPNEKLIGKDVTELQDIDGKFFVKERKNLAKTNKEWWHDYKFTNPVTKKVEAKDVYCQLLEDLMVCAGVYKN